MEPDETFNVVLSAPTGATLAHATGIGTITNDDVAPPVVPSIYISDAVTGEGGLATFTITLSESTTGPVSVTYGTSEDTASSADFTAAGGTVNFAAGETTKTITVQTTQDSAVESDRHSMSSWRLPLVPRWLKRRESGPSPTTTWLLR